MSKADFPVTPGTRFLEKNSIPFIPHLYPYEDHGGTAQAARFLKIPEHQVIKTLVMDSELGEPFLVLMHGDREVSTRNLARLLDVKRIIPCDVISAQKLTGYQVGGISPFGTRRALRVYAEKTIFALPWIVINGGKRGFLVEIEPQALRNVLELTEVQVAVAVR
jgi:Cys-tRNA(Pro) deacylase